MKAHVLYHSHCNDGFTAAYAAHQYFGDDARYLPVQYGQPLPEIPDGADVYILDFSYERETLLALQARTHSLTVLDHHASAERQLSDLPFATFDMSKSGAVLAWGHFFPGRRVPELFLYVQDRDLWRWALPDSREINAVLQSLPHDFATWKAHHYQLDDEPKVRLPLVEAGAAILRREQQIVEQQAKTARITRDVDGNLLAMVNASALLSETGDRLCTEYPEIRFALLWRLDSRTDQVYVSLRSRGDFDVGAYAQRRYQGGGHPGAAGFEMHITRFYPEWLL